MSSYGGYLRYRLHTQTMRGDAFLIVETTRPDVILKVLEQRVSFSQVYQEFLLEAELKVFVCRGIR